ncbi:MAG: tRNA uridine-5-carboxymethylaminomethyl(34) synthesis enzyme MnmG, partial [Fusobacteriaceae bacterium]
DLIHKKTPEPYRVLPSRAEYRLTLRFDNAFMRLYEVTREIGLVSEERLAVMEKAIEIIGREIARLKEISVPMSDANKILISVGEEQRLTKGVKASEILKFKNVSYRDLATVMDIEELPQFISNQIETLVKYEVFIEREQEQIERFKKLEDMKIDSDTDYSVIRGLSNIAKSGLEEVKPFSIGEASRISGVTGNDIALIIAHLRR